MQTQCLNGERNDHTRTHVLTRHSGLFGYRRGDFMKDFELLELAAKAAELRIDISKTSGGPNPNTGFDLAGNVVLDWHNGKTWNPLTNDGDAFRLAVMLGLVVDLVGSSVHVTYGEFASECCVEDYGLDPFIATRRAIVRAAAEIGKAMP